MPRFSSVLPLLLAAGAALPGAPPDKVQEDAVIEAGRRGAKPRPVSPRGGLGAPERQRAALFRKAKASVLHVEAIVPVRKEGSRDLFRIPAGTGTAFVWDESGHVVTNNHVITVTDEAGRALGEAPEFDVTLADGKTYKGRVIGRSITYDVAVLKVFAPLKDLPPLPLGRAKDLVVGQDVLAIGSPFGLDHTLTSGIVSALNREVLVNPSLPTLLRGMIQVDAPINPGNSGGPLLDSAGRLVGMNTSIASTSGSSAGIGFAIPVETLNRVVPLLIAKGHHERPELGFTGHVLTGMDTGGGFIVSSVEPNSPAGRAGLRPWRITPEGQVLEMGDVVVGLNGHPVRTTIEFTDLLELEPPEAPVVLELLRDGARVKVTLYPKGDAPADPAKTV